MVSEFFSPQVISQSIQLNLRDYTSLFVLSKMSRENCQHPIYSKLILILRNPVTRAYSRGSLLMRRNSRANIETLMTEHHEIIVEHGFYSSYIKDFFEFFKRDQFLILIFENYFADIHSAKKTIAKFLETMLNDFLRMLAPKKSASVSFQNIQIFTVY